MTFNEIQDKYEFSIFFDGVSFPKKIEVKCKLKTTQKEVQGRFIEYNKEQWIEELKTKIVIELFHEVVMKFTEDIIVKGFPNLEGVISDKQIKLLIGL
ncbi:hypothetical protein [uncultured Tenacibaculum sp.]|uniref:hypothetical protein n=1 Tax=uncultured Tenacibaculum sp. TaxID=174713 RepID=UPI0026156657|nr:hypothetical protein [uncultured Tenacibaculum sp.]